jgi:hypothetical protein
MGVAVRIKQRHLVLGLTTAAAPLVIVAAPPALAAECVEAGESPCVGRVRSEGMNRLPVPSFRLTARMSGTAPTSVSTASSTGLHRLVRPVSFGPRSPNIGRPAATAV